MDEILTLILDDYQIKVNKGQLANKSRYFASLFSHNFNDSHNKEYVINYDISHTTLRVLILTNYYKTFVYIFLYTSN